MYLRHRQATWLHVPPSQSDRVRGSMYLHHNQSGYAATCTFTTIKQATWLKVPPSQSDRLRGSKYLHHNQTSYVAKSTTITIKQATWLNAPPSQSDRLRGSMYLHHSKQINKQGIFYLRKLRKKNGVKMHNRKGTTNMYIITTVLLCVIPTFWLRALLPLRVATIIVLILLQLCLYVISCHRPLSFLLSNGGHGIFNVCMHALHTKARQALKDTGFSQDNLQLSCTG